MRSAHHGLVGALLATVLAAPPAAAAPVPVAQSPAGDTLRLDLATAVAMAAERSPTVAAERYGTAGAEARVALDRADLLPHVSAAAQHGQRTFNTASFGLEFPSAPGEPPLFDPNGEVVGPVTTIDLRGTVEQTLFDWSAVSRVRAARADVRAAEAGVETAREAAARRAASAWLRATTAESRLQARAADVELADDLLDVARGLLDAGVGVRLDVTRAEAQVATMEAALVQSRSDAERTRLALLDALALPFDTPVVLVSPDADPTLSAPPPDTTVAGALAHRPDLVELDRRIEASRSTMRAFRAERLPTVSLVADDGFTGGDYGHLLDTWEWGVRVSVPVFDGSRRAARIDEQSSTLSALQARRDDLSRAVAYGVRDALLRMETAERLVDAAALRLDLAGQELDQARERFRTGVAGSADVFTASLRLNEARTATVDARAAYLAARIDLAAAEGTVLHP